MKRQIHTLLGLCLILLLSASSAFAQLSPSNNLGIFPPPGPFNPNGKFTTIGESGGVPGPINGCDLYGFRAQTSPTKAVNIGMRGNNPSIVFGESASLSIIERNAANGGGINLTNGCGRTLGFFRASQFGSVLFTLYGSGLAFGGSWTTSDRNFKKNIETIPNAIEIVNSLRGVSYDYRVDEYPQYMFKRGKSYGFITQEVQQVLPDAVQVGPDANGQPGDYQIMNYDMITPVLTQAIKEQQAMINQQQELLAEQLEINQKYEDLITKLETRITALENEKDQTAIPQNDLGASSMVVEGVSLRQNRPNPFKGVTTIDYTIPSDKTNARLVIYNLEGKALNSFALEAGDGQITINANDLSSGVYFYTLEDNGATLARQKMIVK